MGQIAWSQTNWASGRLHQLWMAGIGGSNPSWWRKPTRGRYRRVLRPEPVQWLDDGDLVYARQVSESAVTSCADWSSLYR
jgi:hypothetical protein